MSNTGFNGNSTVDLNGKSVPVIQINGSDYLQIGRFTVPFQAYLYPDVYCTVKTCPLDLAQIIGYIPTLAGNSLFLGLFGLALILQVFLGIRFKTWGFLLGMVLGLLLEILGYLGRVELHNNPFSADWFKMYAPG